MHVCLYTHAISSSPVTPEYAQRAEVYLLGPSMHDMKEDPVSVTCLLFGHRLKLFSVTWKVGNDISKGDTKETPKDHGNGTESYQKVLKVPAEKWNTYTTVSCEVRHLCSTTPQQHNISKTRGKCSHKRWPFKPKFILLEKERKTLCVLESVSKISFIFITPSLKVFSPVSYCTQL